MTVVNRGDFHGLSDDLLDEAIDIVAGIDDRLAVVIKRELEIGK